MRSRSESIRRVAVIVVTGPAAMLLAGCDAGKPIHTGGNYAPVTAEQLARANFSHRTGGEDFDFDWSFDAETFVIEGNEIPPDLLTAMRGPGATASRIEGTWQIRDGRIHFLVNALDAGGKPREFSLPIYFTGVIRIETKEAQYVF